MPKRKSNPVDWKRQADWHEAEGAKRRVPKKGEPILPMVTVSQDIARIDIVETLCGELRQEGLTPRQYIEDKMGKCALERVAEQKHFITKTRPHYLSRETKTWAEQYLNEIERREKAGKYRRIPFKPKRKKRQLASE